MSVVKVVAAIILKKRMNGQFQVLIAKRPLDKHKGGYWEFPGGKIENHESDSDALSREILEEINLTVEQTEFYESIQFDYPEKTVLLKFYLVTEFSGVEKGLEQQEIKWVAIEELNHFQFPEANQLIVERLQTEYKNKTISH